jgi:hypothetical protein
MSNIAQATANAPAHAPVHTPAPLPQQATNAPAAQAVIPPVAPAVSVPNQPPPPIPVPARSGRLDIVKDWWWEALTWLVGTISTWLLMALLCHFDKKPVSQWKSKISLNAIVAILSQAAQSALCVSVGSCISQLKWRWIKTDQPVTDIALFDRASRGPEGSLVLLMKMIFKYHSM